MHPAPGMPSAMTMHVNQGRDSLQCAPGASGPILAPVHASMTNGPHKWPACLLPAGHSTAMRVDENASVAFGEYLPSAAGDIFFFEGALSSLLFVIKTFFGLFVSVEAATAEVPWAWVQQK